MIRQFAAAALIVAVSAGSIGRCVGWDASPEARMACCAAGSACPMHTPENSSSARGLTQAEADRCCAGSEGADSRAAAALVAVLSPLPRLISILEPPAAVSIDIARSAVTLHHRHVPTHVLLTVFLI